MKIEERMVEFRKNSKLTQEQFSNSIGMSRNRYLNYEKGRRKFYDELLIIMYEKYDLNPLWLLTGIGEMQVNKAGQTTDLVLNLRSKDYKLDTKGDEIIDLVTEATKSTKNLVNDLKDLVVEKILDQLFNKRTKYENKIGWKQVKNKLFPNNRKQVFFIEILNNLEKDGTTLINSYKEYLCSTISEYKINYMYTQKDVNWLLESVNKMNENDCKIIIKYVKVAKKITNADISIDTKIFIQYALNR